MGPSGAIPGGYILMQYGHYHEVYVHIEQIICLHI